MIFRRPTAPETLSFGQAVPADHVRGAYHELLHAAAAGAPWRLCWRARSQMALDEFEALPLLEEAHAAFENAFIPSHEADERSM